MTRQGGVVVVSPHEIERITVRALPRIFTFADPPDERRHPRNVATATNALQFGVAVALFARRGLWGLVADRLNIRVFPVGYWLWPAGEARRRRGLPGRRPGPDGRRPAAAHGPPPRA